MRRFLTAAILGLAFATTSASALADPGGRPAHARQHQEGEQGKRPSFPMKGAEFRSHVEKRLAKTRARVEKRAEKLPADQAKALRDRFESVVKEVRAEVDRAAADDVVTKDEAKKVREAARKLGGGKGKHHKSK